MDLASWGPGYKHVEKVWGEEIWLANHQHYCAKLLIPKLGMQSSLHMHPNKIETFYVLRGRVGFRLGHQPYSISYMDEGDSIHLPATTCHRFWALTDDTVILEVSTFHSDADVIRVSPSGPVEPF